MVEAMDSEAVLAAFQDRAELASWAKGLQPKWFTADS